MKPFAVACLALAGCAEAPTYQYGVPLQDVEYRVFTLDTGVHPDESIRVDPNNPFTAGLTGDTKWDIESSGFHEAAYYAWATMLVNEPTGEHQYYTALNLQRIYERQLAEPEDVYYARDIAIRGYQVILDEFPDSVTFDASGRVSFWLAPLAYDAIVGLGGTPEGWTEVATEDGGTTVVPTE